MAELTEIDSETLMNCVRNYRVIYDNSLKDFKVPSKKNNAWKEISAKLGIELEYAKRRYNSIRTKFSKYLKRVKSTQSGSERNDLLEIREEFEHLRWLLVHIKHRKSTANFKRMHVYDITTNTNRPTSPLTESMVNADHRMDEAEDESEDENSCNEATKENESVKNDDSVCDDAGQNINIEEGHGENRSVPDVRQEEGTSDYKHPKGRKRSRSKEAKPIAGIDMDRGFMKALTSLKKSREEREPEKKEEAIDDDYHFCLSLVGSLKNLEPRFKSMAKFQVMKVFNDIEWARNSKDVYAPESKGSMFEV